MFLLSLVEKRHLNRLDIPRFYLEHLFVSFFAHYFPGAWLRRERGGWMDGDVLQDHKDPGVLLISG